MSCHVLKCSTNTPNIFTNFGLEAPFDTLFCIIIFAFLRASFLLKNRAKCLQIEIKYSVKITAISNREGGKIYTIKNKFRKKIQNVR